MGSERPWTLTDKSTLHTLNTYPWDPNFGPFRATTSHFRDTRLSTIAMQPMTTEWLWNLTVKPLNTPPPPGEYPLPLPDDAQIWVRFALRPVLYSKTLNKCWKTTKNCLKFRILNSTILGTMLIQTSTHGRGIHEILRVNLSEKYFEPVSLIWVRVKRKRKSAKIQNLKLHNFWTALLETLPGGYMNAREEWICYVPSEDMSFGKYFSGTLYDTMFTKMNKM